MFRRLVKPANDERSLILVPSISSDTRFVVCGGRVRRVSGVNLTSRTCRFKRSSLRSRVVNGLPVTLSVVRFVNPGGRTSVDSLCQDRSTFVSALIPAPSLKLNNNCGGFEIPTLESLKL